MSKKLHTLKKLKDEGKIHTRLIFQIRILTVISLILLGVVAYQVIARGLDLSIVLLISSVSFLLGLFVFSKMNKLVWNEEEEVIKTARMEVLGFVVLGLYILFEIGLRTILNTEFPGTFAAIAYLLSGIGSSLLGRSVGTLRAIAKLNKKHGLS